MLRKLLVGLDVQEAVETDINRIGEMGRMTLSHFNWSFLF